MDTGVIPALPEAARFAFAPSHAGWRLPLYSVETKKPELPPQDTFLSMLVTEKAQSDYGPCNVKC